MVSSHIRSLVAKASQLAILLMGALVLTAVARPLQLATLEPQRVERLSPEARRQYELGLAAIDKIMYAEGLTYLQAAASLGHDDDHLRFMIVQLATYLGDTRYGSDSTKFYSIATDNLRALANSPRLNLRERGRAQEALQKLIGLQQSISERDENRKKWGMELAKKYMKELKEGYNDAAQKQNEVEKRKRLIQMSTGNLGTVQNYLGGLGAGGDASQPVRIPVQPSAATGGSGGPINRPSTPDLTGRPTNQGPAVDANDAASPGTGAPTDFNRANQ